MHGSIDELDGGTSFRDDLFGEQQFVELRKILFVHALAYHRDVVIYLEVIRAAREFFHGDVDGVHREIIGDLGYVFNDFRGGFGRHLRAVLAVNFISVVFFRVVARGDHYARNGVQRAHGERAHRHGTHVLEYERFDLIRRKHFGDVQREFSRKPARIVSDNDAARRGFLAYRKHVTGKSRGGALDGVAVHTVSSESHFAAHARGTEREFETETLFLLVVVVPDSLELGAFRFAHSFKPYFVSVLIHKKLPPFDLYIVPQLYAPAQ